MSKKIVIFGIFFYFFVYLYKKRLNIFLFLKIFFIYLLKLDFNTKYRKRINEGVKYSSPFFFKEQSFYFIYNVFILSLC